MEVIAWIVCIVGIILGALIIVFPDFFIELSHFWDNQFLYWIGAGFTFNSSKGKRVLMRIFGGVLVLGTLWIMRSYLF